ncbi:helix-turn-helix domain-containing protein [Pseudomonas sp. N2-5-1-1]|uniref:helix-turn-helix domain-containing protein n=1 Tax=unclassified Pseudomonas TaxID=196821 RepID=UPI0034E0B984
MELKKAFGQALKQMRTHKGLTQEDFSNVSSRTYLSTLERGLKSPTIDKLGEIASVMEVHPVSILVHSYLLRDRSMTIEQLFERVQEELGSI